MSCYLRHLRDLFAVLGLEYDAEHRALVDSAIRDVLGLSDDDACPKVWSAVKALSEDERDKLSAQVAERLA